MSADPWSTSPLLLALHLAVHCLPRCRSQLYLRHTPCPNPRPPTHAHLSAHIPPHPHPRRRPRPRASWLEVAGTDHVTFPAARSPVTRPPILFEASVQLSLPWCFWSYLLPRALNKAFLPKAFSFESLLSLIIFVLLSVRYHKIGISPFLPRERDQGEVI